LSTDLSALATLIAAASMLATPVLFALSERFVIPRLRGAPEPVFDTIESADAPVILAGFGRVGQIVGRVLNMHHIPFVALERDSGQVDVIRRFGGKVYYGDAARPDVLRAAGADRARLLIVALDDVERNLRTVETAKRNHPNLTILARARNRRHAHLLMDRGVDGLVRDTFHSSLRLAELGLTAMGVAPEAAARAIGLFRDHDEANLVAAHAIYSDEAQMIQSAQQAAEELASLFEADREST
jgi:voltage-gated potassium channel Kch